VVGEILLPDNSTFHAFIYSDGAMTDLNSLIDQNSGWVLRSATGINNAGDIVGYGTDSSGQTHAFLLTPETSPSGSSSVPEPASAATLGVAGLLLLRRRRRA
jgi:probable HAF family extracellular repeat protein